MRFALFGAAFFAAVNALPTAQDTNELSSVTGITDIGSDVPAVEGFVPSLESRQQHPGGPGRTALIQLLGKSTYLEISSALHAVGISVAHTEQEINQIVSALSPSLGDDLHQLLTVIATLEADLVSIGFNT